MRVVYLNPSGQMGGAEMSLMDLLVEYARRRAPLAVLGGDRRRRPLGPSGPGGGRAGDPSAVSPCIGAVGRFWKRLPAGVVVLFQASAGTIRYAWNLRRTLRELEPDIVHTNGFKMHVLGAWARPRTLP